MAFPSEGLLVCERAEFSSHLHDRAEFSSHLHDRGSFPLTCVVVQSFRLTLHAGENSSGENLEADVGLSFFRGFASSVASRLR